MQVWFYTFTVFRMSTKLSTSTKKNTSIKRNIKNPTPKKGLSWKIVGTKEDKMLEKVEKYVDKNREKISQEIMEKKNKRPVTKYNAADLEIMISRIDNESKKEKKNKKISKWILFIIYTIIIIAILIFVIKYFFVEKMPQIP